MRMTRLCFFLASLLLGGCATSHRTSPPAPTAMPDGRDLTEDPLDVLAIPQP